MIIKTRLAEIYKFQEPKRLFLSVLYLLVTQNLWLIHDTTSILASPDRL